MHPTTRFLVLSTAALSWTYAAMAGCGGSGQTMAGANGAGGGTPTSNGSGQNTGAATSSGHPAASSAGTFATSSSAGTGGKASGTGGVAAGTGGVVSGTGGGQPMGCNTYPGQDPSMLPGSGCCMYGPSHCVPASSIPPGLDSAFAACGSGGLCVPDPIIQAGSEYVPAPCTATLLGMNLAGVCLSQCILLVSTNPDVNLLPKATCGQGELCVPCTNPLNNMPTGACSISSLACGGDGGTDGGGTGGGAPDSGGGPTCPYTGPPLIDPTQFPMCTPACGGAHCLPAALVPAADASQLAPCTSPNGPGYCAPDSFIASAGEGVPKTCTSIAGSEGRCLSTCLPAIAAEASLLPTDICAAGERCAPCYNPTASDPTAPTGACSLACDKPANPPTILTCPYTGPNIIDPTTLPACDNGGCAGAHCLPAALVPAAEQSQLAPCGSGATAGYCAPDTLIASAGLGVPPACTSVAGAEGRCLSTCLPSIAAEASLLPQDICAAGTVCAPCYNPTAADPTAPTGACSLACDKPAKPPTIITCPWTGPPILDPTKLPPCDSGGCAGAHCLPAALVPASVQSQLAPCNGGTGFCAPDEIISTADNFIPTSCDPFPGTGAPGRCLSSCLPAIQAEAAGGTLGQGTCAANQICAPCNDPFTGVSTGACSLGCDTPPATPFTFPPCCDDGTGTLTGTCVPSAQVPASEQSELSADGNGNSAACPSNGASYLCVPDEYLPAPYNSIPLQFCQATFANYCGTCVSQCIVNSGLDFLGSDDCSPNHKCVPCTGFLGQPGTPGCSGFCTGGAVCGNGCNTDADCSGTCPYCSGGVCDSTP